MYRAIHMARQLANFCLMMSDTPVDNTFMPCSACSVDTISLRRGECDGHSLARQPRQAAPNIVRCHFAPSCRYRARQATGTQESNLHHQEFWRDCHGFQQSFHAVQAGSWNEEGSKSCWWCLSPFGFIHKARQLSYHPMLGQLHKIERAAQLAALNGGHEALLAKRYKDMRQDHCWLSAWTYRIVTLVHRHLEYRPNDVMAWNGVYTKRHD